MCTGMLEWRLVPLDRMNQVPPTNWQAGRPPVPAKPMDGTETTSGRADVSAPCRRNPNDPNGHKVTGILGYKATIGADGPVRGRVKIQVTPVCPGGAGSSIIYTVTIDQNANQGRGVPRGIDRETSDLGGHVDSDHDMLTDDEESRLGTNPNNPDSDGDGVSDFNDRFPLNAARS
jgi:hypothetical protein